MLLYKQHNHTRPRVGELLISEGCHLLGSSREEMSVACGETLPSWTSVMTIGRAGGLSGIAFGDISFSASAAYVYTTKSIDTTPRNG